jgi:hypothetical protein
MRRDRAPAQKICRPVLLAFALLAGASLSTGAQTVGPHRSDDACDQWHFEQSD